LVEISFTFAYRQAGKTYDKVLLDMKHHTQTINDLKLQNRIFKTILFFSLVAGVLYILREPIVSPCPDTGCKVEIVYQVKNLTIEEQLLVEGVRKFGLDHVTALRKLVFKESSLNPYAVNTTSGACGLFQFLPCSKMKCSLGDVECQIAKGLKYIEKRYGDPTNALSFHIKHGWY